MFPEFSTSFLDRLDRQVSSLSGDLESLGSMVVDTVSFEELLSHCNEIYKDNAKRMAELEDKMKDLGIDLGLFSSSFSCLNGIDCFISCSLSIHLSFLLLMKV